MRELNHVLREANQMFVGGRLYYALKKRELVLLKKYAANNPTVKEAIRETSPMTGHPASLFLVPVELIKAAEGDMID